MDTKKSSPQGQNGGDQNSAPYQDSGGQNSPAHQNTGAGHNSASGQSSTHDRELSLSRTINAPVALVWEMWSDQKHIANWWGPIGFTTTIIRMDFRPEGEWDLIMHGPDGTNYDNCSVFKEIVKHKRIVYMHLSYPRYTGTIEFQEREDKTFLTWHMLFESAEVFREAAKKFGIEKGLQQNAEKLADYLGTIAN
jgi:uncharacterized protein YndB with AHSA1/START domain